LRHLKLQAARRRSGGRDRTPFRHRSSPREGFRRHLRGAARRWAAVLQARGPPLPHAGRGRGRDRPPPGGL